jgi:hypothetical protein
MFKITERLERTCLLNKNMCTGCAETRQNPCEKTTIDVPGSREDHKLITTSVERNGSRKHDC